MGKAIKKYTGISMPGIGMRIIKSAVAILLCYLVSFLRRNSGIVFYSQLAALWCIQGYVENSKKNAKQRLIGTTIGALYGLAYLLTRARVETARPVSQMVDAFFISAMIVLVLYTTVLIKKKQASYFSCVVFLSIVVNHVTDANPYLFVWNRFLDTVIGIVIGVGINTVSLPYDKRNDILFLSGLDDTLLINKKNKMSDYSKVELNRMLDDGANFTVSTMRTPASIMEAMSDIRLKLPVIAMNGAVLYNVKEKQYLKVYVISHDKAKQVRDFIYQEGLTCFSNVIIDDTLVIYYDENDDAVQQSLVKELRCSPYRNYVRRELPENEDVVYFMMLYPKDIISKMYTKLEENGFTRELKVITYDSDNYPGYAYIKIYNKNASKQHMIEYLKNMTEVSQTITFGSIPGQYDVLIEEGDINKVVHMLKRIYEPIKWVTKR